MKIRIKFEKWGELKFIGHLDVMRYFQKVMRRAHVDIKYSGGYSPHQIMSFAQPLGLGITSEGEYLDIEVASTLDSKTMLEQINAANVENMICTAYRLLPEKSKAGMAILVAADYKITWKDTLLAQVKPGDVWDAYYGQDKIIRLKEVKKGVEEVDIKPLIFDAKVCEDGLWVKLSCCSGDNLRPDTLMENLFAYLGIVLPAFSYTIHREEMYSRTEDGAFISLMDMGTEITEPLSDPEEE